MTNIRELYDQLTEHPYGFRAELNFNALADAIIAELEGLRATLFGCNEDSGVERSSSNEEINERTVGSIDLPKFDVQDPNDIFVKNAQAIRNVDLSSGIVIQPAKSYIYGYSDLTFEEFCSYIYWRTGIRNHCASISEASPRGFLYLYLFELVNLVEYDSIEETLFALNRLLSLQQAEVHLDMISDAIREFALLYGSTQAVEDYVDMSNYKRLHRAEILRNGDFSDALDYLADYFTKNFKKNAFYQANEDIIRLAFPYTLRAVDNYFQQNGLPLMKMWIGKQVFHQMRFRYVKQVETNRIMPKTIVCNKMTMYKVLENGKVYIVALDSFGKEKDPGQCVFARSYIMQSIYSLFEFEFRKIMGARSNKVKISDLRQMSVHSPAVTMMAEAFEGEELGTLVRKAILEVIQ